MKWIFDKKRGPWLSYSSFACTWSPPQARELFFRIIAEEIRRGWRGPACPTRGLIRNDRRICTLDSVREREGGEKEERFIRFFYSVFCAFYSSNVGFLACGGAVTSSVNFHSSSLNIEMSQSDAEMFITMGGGRGGKERGGRRKEASKRKSPANLKL